MVQMSSQTTRGVASAKRSKPQSVESRRSLPSVRASQFGDFEGNPARTEGGGAFFLSSEKRSLRSLQSLFCFVAMATLVLNLCADVTATPAPHPPPSPASVHQKTSLMDAMKMELISTVTGRLSLRWRRQWMPTVDAHANEPLELRLSVLETLTTELNEDLNAVLANFPEVAKRKSMIYFISQSRELFLFCFRNRLGITGKNSIVPVGPFASIAFGEPDQLMDVDRWPAVDATPLAEEKEQEQKSAGKRHAEEEESQKTPAPENVQTPEQLPRAGPVETESDANVETESDANIETESDANVETESDADVETESDANVETESDANVETESDANVETESDANVETESDANVETESDANVETENDAEDGNDATDQTQGGMQANLELVTDGDGEKAAVESFAEVAEALKEAEKVFEEWDKRDTDAQSADAVQQEAEKVLKEMDAVLTQAEETGTANAAQEVAEMLQQTEVPETPKVPQETKAEKEAESTGLAEGEPPVTAELQEADKVMQEVEEVLGKMKTLEVGDLEESTQAAELQDRKDEETSQGDEDDEEEEDDDDGEADEEDGDEDEEGAQEAESA
uniref:Uncharacterized protein n=1 Tax=Toxoplasma gondii COUG TaxID=1074873 RepID=A0A2G8Y0Q7_TOXGO|nr:hypothetical protein TGCOUG_315910 [Toxoplasma gondii COUG]